MHFIITGCGRVGAHLAEYLAYKRHNVVVIDRDPASFTRLGGTFNGITLQGVAFDEELLKQAGIERADALAAVTNYDSTNLMTAEIASSIFKVPIVVARLYNPDKRQTYHKLGIEYVCGTSLLAERIKDKLLQGQIAVQCEEWELGVRIVEVTIGAGAEGKAISSFYDTDSQKILGLFRGNMSIEWSGDTRLLADDKLVIALRDDTEQAVLELLAGKRP